MSHTNKKRMAAYGFVGASVALLCVMLHFMLKPDLYRRTDPAQTIGYVYVHDDDQKAGRQQIVQGDFWSFDREDPLDKVVLWVKAKGLDEEKPLAMAKAPHCSRWLAPIGLKRRGDVVDNFTGRKVAILDRYLYTIEITTRSGKTAVIKPERIWLEKLLGWSEEKRFKLTFEGEVSRFWLILHIALMVAAPLFLVHAVYDGIRILVGVGDPLPRLKTSLLWGWTSFFAAAVPIGVIVTWQAFRVGFEPWPLGGDVTDTKSVLLILLWVGLWLGCRKAGERTWAVVTLAGAVASTLIYLVPHSMIVQ